MSNKKKKDFDKILFKLSFLFLAWVFLDFCLQFSSNRKDISKLQSDLIKIFQICSNMVYINIMIYYIDNNKNNYKEYKTIKA